MYYLEILVVFYALFGVCLYLAYLKDVQTHALTIESKFLRKILYIVTFIVGIIFWPLLIG